MAMNKNAVLAIGLAVPILAFVILSWKLIDVEEVRQSNNNSDLSTVAAPMSSEGDNDPVAAGTRALPTAPVEFGAFGPADIRAGQIEWNEPEDLGDLGWIDREVYEGTYSDDIGSSLGVRYVRVGRVTLGKYAGAEVLVVLDWIRPLMPQSDAPRIRHYLRFPDRVVWLPNASVPEGKSGFVVSGPDFVKPEDIGRWNATFEIRAPNVTVDVSTRIEEIAWYPNELLVHNGRARLMHDTYLQKGFFSPSGMTMLYEDERFGPVWTAGGSLPPMPSPLNALMGRVGRADGSGYDLVKRTFNPVVSGNFFIRRPDGIIEGYYLSPDIFGDESQSGQLLATWSDGTRNETAFQRYPGGCGQVSYADVVTGRFDLTRDLIPIGTADQGDTLYGYRSVTHPDFVKAYGYAKDGITTTPADVVASPEAFLAARPDIFWVDPFGRILRFKNTEIAPIAECGKPVLYLYPEERTDVSVRVYPDRGVRISDPVYLDGWEVVASPDGTLLNKRDGRTYPSLFWEGGSEEAIRIPVQGFVVGAAELDDFFDRILPTLGLQGREITDFKEFWVPKMRQEHSPYYRVSFLPREDIDRLAPLSIVPAPDTTIRVMMDFEPLDEYVSPQVPVTYQPPLRRGFTVVEWGGRLR